DVAQAIGALDQRPNVFIGNSVSYAVEYVGLAYADAIDHPCPLSSDRTGFGCDLVLEVSPGEQVALKSAYCDVDQTTVVDRDWFSPLHEEVSVLDARVVFVDL